MRFRTERGGGVMLRGDSDVASLAIENYLQMPSLCLCDQDFQLAHTQMTVSLETSGLNLDAGDETGNGIEYAEGKIPNGRHG